MKKILIANRGEIAVRIIKSCQKLKIKTVAIFSDADKNSPYVSLADESFPLNANYSSETYLNIDKIISIAKQTKATAIHPGYGFLSENADFAEAVRKNNIIFIGPTTETLKTIGNKDSARILAKNLNIPVIPGYEGSAQDFDTLKKAAFGIGFPLLIKATAGGGGKGMRVVKKEEELQPLLESASREALSFFANANVILEKYIDQSRHLEIQLLGDNFGNLLHLFERECSLQRRYQKVIEESPANNISQALKEKLYAAALSIGKAIKLQNAATVEFLIPHDQGDSFYFLEVNPRIQVEHPVTEEVLGIDIVEQQIRIALNEKLQLLQEDIKPKRHAIELRVCAEIPTNNFQASTGKIKHLVFPMNKNLRIEHSLKEDIEINTYYDSLLLKLIGTAKNRETCVVNILAALDSLVISGIETNIGFLKNLLKELQNSTPLTQFIDKNIARLTASDSALIEKLTTLALAAYQVVIAEKNNNPFFYFRPSAEVTAPLLRYQLNSVHLAEQQRTLARITSCHKLVERKKYSIEISNNVIELELISFQNNRLHFTHDKEEFVVYLNQVANDDFNNPVINLSLNNIQFEISRILNIDSKSNNLSSNLILAPLPAKILKIHVAQNSLVTNQQLLIVFESMKMEHQLIAEYSGLIEEIFVAEGSQVKKGDPLFLIKP